MCLVVWDKQKEHNIMQLHNSLITGTCIINQHKISKLNPLAKQGLELNIRLFATGSHTTSKFCLNLCGYLSSLSSFFAILQLNFSASF